MFKTRRTHLYYNDYNTYACTIALKVCFMFLVVQRTTKLTNEEITRMSEMVGVDWDRLAALMNTPYSEREEIRVNYAKYPSFFLKARQIFTHFNENKDFDRYFLKKCLKELGRHDLENEMLPVKNEVFHNL